MREDWVQEDGVWFAQGWDECCKIDGRRTLWLYKIDVTCLHGRPNDGIFGGRAPPAATVIRDIVLVRLEITREIRKDLLRGVAKSI